MVYPYNQPNPYGFASPTIGYGGFTQPMYWPFPQGMVSPHPHAYGYRYAPNMNNPVELKDYGPQPFVANIEEVTKHNQTFRTAVWTGEHLQVTVMSIPVGGDIGLEIHPDVDQFLSIEEGQGFAQMGEAKDRLTYQTKVYEGYAIMVPAGKWHNLTNTGNKPLKLYTIYAPPEHPAGTVHKTKADAMAQEKMQA